MAADETQEWWMMVHNVNALSSGQVVQERGNGVIALMLTNVQSVWWMVL